MTVYKTLKTETRHGVTVTAWEAWDKYDRLPRYEITVARGPICSEAIKAARTTWSKKYNEIVKEF